MFQTMVYFCCFDYVSKELDRLVGEGGKLGLIISYF